MTGDKVYGLHRVGPNPWDFEYNPGIGQRVSFVDARGNVHTGTVTDFEENEETGEKTLTVERWENHGLHYTPEATVTP
jgi:hypothetical protein